MLPCAKHSMELVARRLAVRTLSKFRETLTKQGLVAATAGEVRKGSNCEELSVSKCLPGYPRKRTLLNTVGMSQGCHLRTFWQPATTIQAAPQKAPWRSGAHLESNGVDIQSLSPGGGTAFGRSQSRGFRDCYWSAAQLGSKMNAFVFQVICVCAVRRFLLLADFVAKGIAAKPARARCGA